MGIVTNVWHRFGYIKCDQPNCNKKLDVSDIKMLEQVAPLSGWKNTDDQWTCPNCVKKEEDRSRVKRARKST